MPSKLALCAALALATAALAKDPTAYQTGKLLEMDSVPCGTEPVNSAQSLAAPMLGTASDSRKTQELLCPQYVLETERLIYRIRPRDQKHPPLLPVGEQAQFRLNKDRMLLGVEGLEGKQREYIVLSMTPRPDSSTADRSTSHPNHLQ
jgi:hypothetical protein